MEPLRHPKTILNDRKIRGTYSDDDLVALGAMYLQEKASQQPYCLCVTNRKPKLCDCLCVFTECSYDYCCTVSKYMVYFAKKSKVEQQMTVIQWIQYTENDKVPRRFLIPQLRTGEDAVRFFNDSEEHQKLQLKCICNAALLTILGYGQAFWTTVKKHVTERSIPIHALAGQCSNNSLNEETQMYLHLFFADIELHSSPTPMRYIREKTGTLHERDKEDIKELPPYFTKRSLYRRYCFDQGWAIATDCKGSPSKKEQKRDESWKKLQQECGVVVSWGTFLAFWARHYRTLVVGKPHEDRCNACHKYCNQLKFKTANREDSDDSSCDRYCEREPCEQYISQVSFKQRCAKIRSQIRSQFGVRNRGAHVSE
eukprot:scaffold17707_cov212-Amphora_coffeaeformis.AAC.11